MKFFIDTANLDQIREANELGVLDGVTTNPSLMAKEGIRGVENQRKHYLEICEIVGGDVSAEVIATDLEGMIKEGEELAALHPNIVVKVPCIEAGIKAIKYFTRKGIRTNCTLVFSVGQALLAAKAGATYVSPFVGRLDDIASDGIELVRKIVEMYDYYDYSSTADTYNQANDLFSTTMQAAMPIMIVSVIIELVILYLLLGEYLRKLGERVGKV